MGFDRRICAQLAMSGAVLHNIKSRYRMPAHAFCREVETMYYHMRWWNWRRFG